MIAQRLWRYRHTPAVLQICTNLCPQPYGGIPPYGALEPRQVLADLPGRDLLVVAGPLVALDADEVVDVVLVAPAAERRAEDVVLLELVRRLEQVRRQRLRARGRAARRTGSRRGSRSSARRGRARSRSRRGRPRARRPRPGTGCRSRRSCGPRSRPGPGMRSICVRLL